jgi:hypothetical protein
MGEPARPPRRPSPGGKPPARPAAEAAPKKKLPIVWIAGGAAGVLLVVVILVVALSGKPAPAPPEPVDKGAAAAERLREAARKAAEAKARETEAAARSAAEVEALEKPLLEMIEWGNFRGAAAKLKDLPKAVQERVGPKLSAAAEAKYPVMLRDAQGLASRDKVAEGKAHLLQIESWGLPALAERAKKDAGELQAPAKAPLSLGPAPAANVAPPTPDPVPDPAKKPEPEPVKPEPAAPAETKAAGPNTTVAARPPRKGPFQPGALPDAEKQKKQAELAAAARKEKAGSRKAAAAKRAEWLAKLERDKGIYDVVTLVD